MIERTRSTKPSRRTFVYACIASSLLVLLLLRGICGVTPSYALDSQQDESSIAATTDSEGTTPSTYVHDPMTNPKAAADIMVDPTAVYGYAPRPDSVRLASFDYDFSDPEVVAELRRQREEYHASFQELYDIIDRMQTQDCTTEEIARAVSTRRNELRLEASADDPEGLEMLKQSNLAKYGNELGGTPEYFYAKTGSWEGVIESSLSSNPGADAVLGLYDKYYNTYIIANGSCGATEGTDNLSWRIQASTLSIQGEGAMQDYVVSSKAPWASYVADFDAVVVGEGVTHVGTHAFDGLGKELDEPRGHAWEQVIRKATPEKDGKLVYQCGVCGTHSVPSVIAKVSNIKLAQSTFTYTGKAIRPSIVVADSMGRALTGVWDVSYANNMACGTATATVTLDSDYYEGTKELSFSIRPAANSMKATGKTVTLKASVLSKRSQKLARTKLVSVSKAQGSVSYRLGTIANKRLASKLSLDSRTGALTVKKGLAKGTYRIKLVVSASGDANHKAKKATTTVVLRVQ